MRDERRDDEREGRRPLPGTRSPQPGGPEPTDALEFRRLTPTLLVRDLDASLAFYRDLLGFTVDTLWPEDDPTLAILDRGSVSVMIQTGGCGSDTDPVFTGDLRIDVSDARALAFRLRERVALEWGPEVYHYGRREFAVRDPDGYLLVFSARTSDPPTDEG